MSGIRWTTGIGIAVGGVGGAVAALLSVPASPPARVFEPTAATADPNAAIAEAATPPPSTSAAAVAAPEPASVPASASAAPAPASSAPTVIIPPLDVPSTTAALLNAQVLCDRKKSYDDCSRVAQALEQGSTGPADPVQGRRFRRIALTHLVRECELGDPHACFVLAEKFRSGLELTASTGRAESLEKRGLELCRLRRAAECPPQ